MPPEVALVTTSNIFAKGLFIRTDQRIAPLTHVDIKLDVPELASPIILRGIVAHRHEGSQEDLQPTGLGIDLRESPSAQLKLLRDLAARWLREWEGGSEEG